MNFPSSFRLPHARDKKEPARRDADDNEVHEISGIVPTHVIDSLLNAMGIDREEGVSPALLKGGFTAVQSAIKAVGRDGWSAGQVLEQVSHSSGMD